MPRFVALRYIAAWIAGFVAGFLFIALGSYVSGLIFPAPQDLDTKDYEALVNFIQTLPPSALFLMLFVQASGAFIAGLVCSFITGRFWLLGQIGLGALFLTGGILNSVVIPHPWWFTVADLLLYLPATFAGAAIGSRCTLWPAESKQPSEGSAD